MKEKNKFYLIILFSSVFLLFNCISAFASDLSYTNHAVINFTEKYNKDYQSCYYILASENEKSSDGVDSAQELVIFPDIDTNKYDLMFIKAEGNATSMYYGSGCGYLLYSEKGMNEWKNMNYDNLCFYVDSFYSDSIYTPTKITEVNNQLSWSDFAFGDIWDVKCNFPCYSLDCSFFNSLSSPPTFNECINYISNNNVQPYGGYTFVNSGSLYNENIPTPKNLEVYFNRKLESPFNIGDMHSPINIKWEVPEDEDYSDYTLETYIDVNYNKINSLGGIGTKPTVLNTGRVKLYEENASHRQMNISDTCEGWSALSEKFETSVWGITGNYLDLWIRYVDSGGNYGNWVKVHITPNNSGSVIKFGGTNTTINKGYEEISGEDNTTKVDDSQYGDKYFVSTKDNGFSESVTNLKSQFGDLISFFSSLFSFLPKEVWELLIAFISACCLVALFRFIRG